MNLTARQQEYVDAVRAIYERDGRPASLTEVSVVLDVSKVTAMETLQALAKRGEIEVAMVGKFARYVPKQHMTAAVRESVQKLREAGHHALARRLSVTKPRKL